MAQGFTRAQARGKAKEAGQVSIREYRQIERSLATSQRHYILDVPRKIEGRTEMVTMVNIVDRRTGRSRTFTLRQRKAASFRATLERRTKLSKRRRPPKGVEPVPLPFEYEPPKKQKRKLPRRCPSRWQVQPKIRCTLDEGHGGLHRGDLPGGEVRWSDRQAL